MTPFHLKNSVDIIHIHLTNSENAINTERSEGHVANKLERGDLRERMRHNHAVYGAPPPHDGHRASSSFPTRLTLQCPVEHYTQLHYITYMPAQVLSRGA